MRNLNKFVHVLEGIRKRDIKDEGFPVKSLSVHDYVIMYKW